jgi:hypothetical protein
MLCIIAKLTELATTILKVSAEFPLHIQEPSVRYYVIPDMANAPGMSFIKQLKSSGLSVFIRPFQSFKLPVPDKYFIAENYFIIYLDVLVTGCGGP